MEVPHLPPARPLRLDSAAELLAHIARAHERTRRVVVLIPPDEYGPAATHGWFSLGDLVRHLATLERWTYAENALGRPSRHPARCRDLAEGREATLCYYDRMHAESMAIFATLDDLALARKIEAPSGAPIALWKWLRTMVDHEAHHRGQVYLLLAMRGLPAPAVRGQGSRVGGLRLPNGSARPLTPDP